MNGSHDIGQKLLLAFAGKSPTPEIIEALKAYQPGGLTLFRSLNIDNPTQVRELTKELQRHANSLNLPPLLIATDQEGGQLMSIGEGTTPLPGNMALGAAGVEELAQKAGEVIGLELAAMGVNVNYAPVCDVNNNPKNPVIGIRSFGEDPKQVALLAAAMILGIQSAGVAAVAKHFPGHGDTESDSHHGLPTVLHTLERLQQVELPPFRSAINAGAKMVMTAHLALPAIDGPDAPPATLSSNILNGLLRDELDFHGVIVTDAMDMQAIRQGAALGEDAVRAVNAGVDLLLLTSDPIDQHRVYTSLSGAIQANILEPKDVSASLKRVLALKHWLGSFSQPDFQVIGSPEHCLVADTIAERSITLVRNNSGLLPLRLNLKQRIAVIMPQPVDLTPADTSSYITPGLATALRAFHPEVDEFRIAYAPNEPEITNLIEQLRDYDLLVLGTLNAYTSPEQAKLVRQALKLGIPTIIIALRLPYDLATYPDVQTYICTYSILEPSMRALAKALFGKIAFRGHLPVSIPGMYPVGYGITL